MLIRCTLEELKFGPEIREERGRPARMHFTGADCGSGMVLGLGAREGSSQFTQSHSDCRDNLFMKPSAVAGAY